MGKQLEDVNKQLKSKQNQLNNKFNQIKKLKNENKQLKKQLSESQQVTHNHHQQNPVIKTIQPPLVPLKKKSVPSVNDEDKQLTIKPTLSYKPTKKVKTKKNGDERKPTSILVSVIQTMNTNVNKGKGSF
ncbi:hypothetical protein QTN25_004456 [Entamoeba marina]